MSTSYAWAGDWSDAVDPSLVMAHTSVVLTRDGSVVVGAAPEPALLFRQAASGDVERIVPVEGVVDPHGITLVDESGEELLWIADTGVKLYGGGTELDIRKVSPSGQVVLVGLDGRTRRTLPAPPHTVYGDTEFRPTAVAVDEPRVGGSGEVWVADGYGASLVHRFSPDGTYVDSISGEEGAGHFNEPHDVLIDRRRDEPELYVADRVNHRLQVYGLEGAYRRTVGVGHLPGPTQLAVSGETLVVTDLLAGRVALFDAADEFEGFLFPHPSPPGAWDDVPDGWPNARAENGTIVPAELQAERFHTPHGVAADSGGRLYVSEFAIGGRIALLDPA